jgi:hypothetical protein
LATATEELQDSVTRDRFDQRLVELLLLVGQDLLELALALLASFDMLFDRLQVASIRDTLGQNLNSRKDFDRGAGREVGRGAIHGPAP